MFCGQEIGKKTHPGSFAVGDTVSFRLRVRNSSSAAGNLDDPIIVDLLPEGLDYISGSWSFDANGTGAPSPIFSETPNYKTSNAHYLKWEMDRGRFL